ncbi:MAG: peptidyl-tRNA hydrolase, family [Gaiellaceae bacterium]|nr:peptidyl-tRNA hydrolase, family [Gaiellaceae bacterium]
MRLWPRRQGSSLDLLVVGLGNPGREYARNRHNVGWLVVDELARRHDGTWKAKYNGQLAEIRLDGHKLALLKPETFMNDSGRSVGAAQRFYKLDPDSVLVVHDEGDFDLGRLQLRIGGGSGGHNGLRSIAQHLKTQDFMRLRVGVGRPERGDPRPLADYVLSNFEPGDDADTLVARAADAVETLDADGIERAQVAVNRR